MSKRPYNGSCHCGAVSFSVELDLTDGLYVRCNCSLCRRKNRGVAVVGAGDFTLLSGYDHLDNYRWNTKREHHYFCRQCGIHTHHTLADQPPRFGINLACIASLDDDEIEPINGDGASLPLIE